MKLEEAKMIFQKYFKDGPGKDFVMSVMDSIEIAPAQEPEAIKLEFLTKELNIPPAADQKPKQAPKKPKICNNCGKEYFANSGSQKICPACKKVFEDIRDTAKELAKSEK